MKILVLGGTGAMGRHLVQLLANDDTEVTVTSRTPKPDEGNVRYVEGNARDTDFLQEILREQWDAIVDFMVYSTSAFESRLSLLLDATTQYVFLSSARVYGQSLQPITEDSPRLLDVSHDEAFLATDEYALAKARQENALLHSGRKNWTIIRPYITYGEERLQLGVMEKEAWLYRALRGRTIVFSSDINEKVTTLTYGKDVAAGLKSLIGEPRALGQVFHITSRDSLPWKDVLAIYLDVLEQQLGRKPKVLLLGLREFFKFHRAHYQITHDRMYDRSFDCSKVGRYANVEDFIPANFGLRNCLEEFLRNPKFLHIDWKTEAMKDRATGERTSLSEIPGLKAKIKYILFRYLPI